MVDRMVYMDHNATTPLHPEVRRTLSEAMDLFGNPSSMHQYGREARSRIEEARESIAQFINAEADEIVFVGSGSEANNTVLNLFPCPSACCTRLREGRAEVITTKIEHPCVLETSRCLGVKGVDVHFLNVDKTGKIDMDQLQSLLSENTALVSVMMANNEIGTIQDIKTIAKMVHEVGAFFHTDAVQAVGKLPVNVRDLDVDFLSFSAHKIYGPKGVGALYVRKGVHYCPFIHGGHQEKGRRAGTENTLGILGLGKAIEMRKLEMKDEEIRLQTLKKRLQRGIESRIPNIYINGHPEDALYSTLNISFEGVEGEAILLYLDLEGIAVSTGSACSSGSLDPSHVILATGTTAEQAHGSIRFSLGRDNTEKDVDYVVDKLIEIIGRLRAMSTAYTPATI
ncbi:cysteine desulfurase [candidate division KSB1 bacterium]|nr:cysteine desulfurase [candidate division KSB1 bacterium]